MKLKIVGVTLLVFAGLGLLMMNLSAAPPVAVKRVVYGATKPVGPYSSGIDLGNMVFLAGQIGLKDGKLVDGGIEAETHQAMKNLQSVLEEAGLGFGHVVKTSVFLADINDFAKMNAVYGSYFPEGGIPPVRSTVEVANIPLGARVEIDFIAAR